MADVPVNVATIAARNYLAHVEVLAASVLEHDPGATVHVLVADAADTPEPIPGAICYGLRDVFGDDRDVWRMATLYDVTAFSTAIKPAFLRALRRELDAVLYLDPDIEVLGPLGALAGAARAAGVALTPHIARPLTERDVDFRETSISVAGIWNLGFVGVGPGSEALLEWWDARLRRQCLNRPEVGLMVDQRWMDFAPAFLDCAIVRDPGCNVAYWNLEHRLIEGPLDAPTVDGSPVSFIHYSGFDIDRPWLLSKYLGERPRVLLSERSDVRRFTEAYAARLLAAGHAERRRSPYGFARAANGLLLDATVRDIYGRALAAHERGERVPEPPAAFGDDDGSALTAWLREPAQDERGVRHLGRYVRGRWDRDDRLRAAHPDIHGPNAATLLRWASCADDVDPLLRPTAADLEVVGSPVPAPGSLLPGINVIGYLRAEYGVGEAGRLVLQGAGASGIAVAAIDIAGTRARRDAAVDVGDVRDAVYDTNVICVNADALLHMNHVTGAELRPGRANVGFWAWETESLPLDHARSAHLLDEIWVGSEYVRAAVTGRVDVPVLTFPLPFTEPPATAWTREEAGFDDRFTFLFIMDFDSVLARKNPLGLIEAYRHAFPDEGATRLVIKTINGHHRTTELERVRYAAGGRGDITVIDGFVEAARRDALVARCDCYVSLHRSEGTGLTMAEAMLRARPVIATGYSGNLDFMAADTVHLVPARRVTLERAEGPYPAGSTWGEPDLVTAAELMRQVARDPSAAAALGLRGREHILAVGDPERGAAFVRRRFEELRRRREDGWVPRAGGAPSNGHGPDDHSGSLPWDSPSRYGAAGLLARRIIRRGLQSYELREREFKTRMAAEVEEQRATLAALDARVRSLAARQADRDADTPEG